MGFPKYDGNIHPDEWINDIQKYFELKQISNNDNYHLKTAISFIKPNISLPDGIDSFEKLRNELKNDISFTVFKNTNKRKLQSLRYNRDEKENINSINELIKIFEDVITDEPNFIRDGDIVTLKHVATGKYLTSIDNLCYTERQLVFAGNLEFYPNSLWKVEYKNSYNTNITNYYTFKLQHIKSNNFKYLTLGNNPPRVRCYIGGGNSSDWILNCSILKNHQGYLTSGDNIKLYNNQKHEFLRSHDIQFTIGNDTFQEVVCHKERLGGNDEWCIELMRKRMT
ncbi:hypothetical protein C1645_877314 [Glomus cerebriforme]|uniref:MIR domain-containing protein n=1 Tax=Glomus cerebriforme TaxID=658196 RepID=A0A397SS61_9GLOM|nr:hypothetical protein C1645_877314 [Glomus cerebriforme]